MSVTKRLCLGLLASFVAVVAASTPAAAQQQQKPKILLSWAAILAGCSRESTIAA